MKRTITAEGYVALPRAIRSRLGVAQGDQLDFVISADGSVTIEKAKVSGLLDGLAGRFAGNAKSSPVSLAEMDDAIRTVAVRCL